jgi:probable FeS assembly SUF system protein SufT
MSMTQDLITLKRDCEATLVPSGEKVTFKEGNQLFITQSLGGSYTVVINGNMARIEGKDADALGKEAVTTDADKNLDVPVEEKLVWDQMKTCYDPEIPVNVVDLGLIYDCKISPMPEGAKGSRVDVKMTLTAPGCGMGPAIKTDVENKIKTIPGVADANVELVWEPQWNQTMMSESAKLQLGLL